MNYRVDVDGTLVSTLYDDVYYSRAGGVAESQHVFLAGNNLPTRWAGRERFRIGELGFGSGLNFWVTLRDWLDDADSPQWLEFYSLEAHPLPDELVLNAARLADVPEQLAASLQQNGFLQVAHKTVMLNLYFTDVSIALRDFQHIDAWYLDGFTPAKNPAMWTPNVLQQIAAASALGATVATFTVARAVRDGLSAAGFTVERCPGFAHKRHCLRGIYHGV